MHLLVHLIPWEKHSQYFLTHLLLVHEHPWKMVMLLRELALVALCSWFSQSSHLHITEQNCPFERHSQYSFRHLVFLHEHTLLTTL